MGRRLSCGVRELLVRCGVFVFLFVLIQLVTMGINAKTTLPGDLKKVAFDDLAEAAFFVLVVFVGLNKEKILGVGSYFVGLRERFFSGLGVLIGFFVYFFYKGFLLDNLVLTARYIYFFSVLELLILFGILFLLLFGVFGRDFFVYFFGGSVRDVFLMLGGVVLVYFFIGFVQGAWSFFGLVVAKGVVYFLGFFGEAQVYYMNGILTLFFDGFVVGISKTCSGIDSVLLFSGLYFWIL